MAMKLTRKAVPQTRVGRRKADINICRIHTWTSKVQENIRKVKRHLFTFPPILAYKLPPK